MMKIKLTVIFLLMMIWNGVAQIPEKFQTLINNGEFAKAQQLMRMELATNLNLSAEDKQSIYFEIERLERIKKDFTKSPPQVIEFIKKYIPQLTADDLTKWENEKSLEYMIIDGQKKYFNQAAANLFRINKEAKKIKQQIDSKKPQQAPTYNRDKDVQEMVKLGETSGEKFINPVRFKVSYTLRVNKNAVPAGKVIRCWLPFPREVPLRQTNIRLISTNPDRYIIADNQHYLQRTIYFEQVAVKDQQTTFQVIFEYTGHAEYNKINPELVKPANISESLAPFVQERPPHIVFTPELKALSKKIVGKETNPYRIAQKLFQWVDENIPWASAREYSTFKNISDYVYRNRHGDCGMQTIFFMTLCRMNGIPTKWQSGWTTEPGDEGMHDWGEIYFEPYGWLPVDVTYGLRKSMDNKVKWYFLGSMDSYRLIVNDDYSQALYPAKVYPRSETIDFQRGEVEWEGGNLYFDQWDYDFDVVNN